MKKFLREVLIGTVCLIGGGLVMLGVTALEYLITKTVLTIILAVFVCWVLGHMFVEIFLKGG